VNDDIEKLVRDSLAEGRSGSFNAGFADRTLARWKNDRSLGDVMAQQLKRLAPIAIAAALLLGFYNAKSGAGTPAIDRLFGLTTITVDAAYNLGAN
jgi:hypothetical protein